MKNDEMMMMMNDVDFSDDAFFDLRFRRRLPTNL